MTNLDWNYQLAEQLDFYWREQLRPRLNGLTDEEYRWEPVPGAWNVRPRGTGRRRSRRAAASSPWTTPCRSPIRHR